MKRQLHLLLAILACSAAAGWSEVAMAAKSGKARGTHEAAPNARSFVLENRHRVRRPRARRGRLPLGPSYVYYDYPYYYSRGYYPRHIGGYVYYYHVRAPRGRCPRGNTSCANRY